MFVQVIGVVSWETGEAGAGRPRGYVVRDMRADSHEEAAKAFVRQVERTGRRVEAIVGFGEGM